MLSVEGLIAETEAPLPKPPKAPKPPKPPARSVAATPLPTPGHAAKAEPLGARQPPGSLKILCRDILLSGDDLSVIVRLHMTLLDREPRADEMAHLTRGFATGTVTRRDLFDKLLNDAGTRWVKLAGKGWLMDGASGWFTINQLASFAARWAWARLWRKAV